VRDAMNILRHEKIRRWESKNWFWAEDPEYDRKAIWVAEGKRDKEKQRALYVELNATGEVCATPEQITGTHSNDEYERGRRFQSCLDSLANNEVNGAWDYKRVENCFRALFSEPIALLE